MKVTENLTICVHPSDFSQKDIHWEDMCEYLNYMCKFKHSVRLDKVEGQPEKWQSYFFVTVRRYIASRRICKWLNWKL